MDQKNYEGTKDIYLLSNKQLKYLKLTKNKTKRNCFNY